MANAYSENELVQKSSLKLLQELGWETAFAFDKEVVGEVGSTFGRKSYREVLLVRYLEEALKRLNSWMNDDQIRQAKEKLLAYSSTKSLLEINEENYYLLRDGIPVTIVDNHKNLITKNALIIDFQNIENNHFLALEELQISGSAYNRRADIVGFVNGIPLLFIEFKKHNVDVMDAYTNNYRDYLSTIPHLFHHNAFIMLSNGIESKIGTLGSKYEFFHEWKRLEEGEAGKVSLETMLKGVCTKENFLDLFENFILYDKSGGQTVKILARNHQYLGVNNALKAYSARKLNNGKLGVFWHTQGSGKSFSMIFFVQKIRRKLSGSPTFVILTDRDDLNKQISDLFENCGILSGIKASKCIATSGSDLIGKLRRNPSFIFTLIQKFNKLDVEPIYPEHDIVIISDEAHRTQYGIFANNMMKLLPTASRIGFTGTPLFSEDEITKRTFGDYISIYDFKRAVEDGATVPLWYEHRAKKLRKIKNPDINEKILEAIEEADLDEAMQEKLNKEFAKEIHLLVAEDRLREIAQDFVKHYSDIWTAGKAMFICLNKVTCVRMYNFVQEYWQKEIEIIEKSIKKNTDQQEVQELKRKLEWMKETEMAVVISQEQNEITTFEKWELNILPHREKMNNRQLDKDFKNSKHHLRVVFVCAMWLTGFDVKSLACLYIDKPLKAHTLMQAIARANRVDEGKSNGLIIDYIGIVKYLKEALAKYTTDYGQGIDPTIDKEELIKRVLELIGIIDSFLESEGFKLADLVTAQNFEKLELLQNGADIIISSIDKKKRFATYANELNRLIKYTDRGDIDNKAREKWQAIRALLQTVFERKKSVDITDLNVEINRIIGLYLEEDTSKKIAVEEVSTFDLSKIDFNLLSAEFSKVKRKNLFMRDLEESIKRQIDILLHKNPTRINFYERYQAIIDEYNNEFNRANIEETFMALMNLVKDISEEERRYVREGFECEEELAIFDMLFRSDLNKEDIKTIKSVAKELLEKIKNIISECDNWTEKDETKAKVEAEIKEELFFALPESYGNSSEEYKQRIFEYVLINFKSIA